MSTSGGVTAAPAGSSFIPAASLYPGLEPAISLAENAPRILVSGSDWAVPITSTPRICPGPLLKAGVAYGHVNFYQGAGAPVAQTHAWIAYLDITGKVLAVSADALAVPWVAGTFSAAQVVLAFTPAADVQTLIAFCITATTPPLLRGSVSPNAFTGSWNPIVYGDSLTTPQIAPPAVASSLALPTVPASNAPYVFASA